MSTTSTPLIKNEDGSFSYGEFLVLAPVYDRSIKKHIFNIIRNGFVPIRHEGNHLTLKNTIKRLTENAVGDQPFNQISGPISFTQPMRIVCQNTGWHGLKVEDESTADELLAAIAPVYPSADLITNEELGIEFPSLEEEPIKAVVEHIDNPLMTALKAVIADPSSQEAYGLFRYHLEEALAEETVEEAVEL